MPDQGRIETAPNECGNTRRGLTLNQGLVDWRAAMQSTCLIDGCSSPQRSRRLCRAHYMEHWKSGTLEQFAVKEFVEHPCSVPGCNKIARKLHSSPCSMHYSRLREHGDFGPAGQSSLHGFSVREKLEQRRRIDHVTGCWNWTASKRSGYGYMGKGSGSAPVHRISYEEYVGPIPAGLHIDHLCRNRACFNPSHLEPVTQAENNRRAAPYRLKTHCKRGHALVDPNLIYRRNGSRECRKCAEFHSGPRRAQLRRERKLRRESGGYS